MKHITVPLLLAASLLAGCNVPRLSDFSVRKQGVDPRRLIDAKAQQESDQLCNMQELHEIGRLIREQRRPAVLPPKKTVLVLSGGGTYGAYSAGVLVGWSETGTRPNFDVVTGVSTGALIAAVAFLGPDMDPELKRFYTTISNNDIFKTKWLAQSLMSESLADATPLEAQIIRVVTPQYMARVAEEHRKGRRLYVGTTELDGRRPVIWDMGSIAQEGTDKARALYGKILLASAAIPGFFPPVRIPIEVDGKATDELHVDGGVTQALFARPPWLKPDDRNLGNHDWLYDSDMYIIVAGKLYADPQPLKLRTLNIAAESVSTLIYSQTRDQLFKLYTVGVLTGMNFRMTAIPEEFEVPGDATTFEPISMTRMFDEGVRQAKSGHAWRDKPPGLERGESVAVRAGTRLTVSADLPGRLVTQPMNADKAGVPQSEQGIPVGTGALAK